MTRSPLFLTLFCSLLVAAAAAEAQPFAPPKAPAKAAAKPAAPAEPVVPYFTGPVTEQAQMAAVLDNDTPQATRPREQEILAATKGRVRREGVDLVLTLKDKTVPARFSSNTSCPEGEANEENCVEYLLVADLPSRGVYVVQKALYESQDYVVVDAATGRQTLIGIPPQFSSDGKRFIEVGFFHADETDAYALQIWRREKDGAVLEWKLPYGDQTLGYVAKASVVKWDGDILNMEFDPSDSSKDTKAPKWRGTIKKAGDTWKLSRD
jgi:hypothetical protein